MVTVSRSPIRGTIHRRPLLTVIAGGAAAVTGIGVAARTGILPGSDTEAGSGTGRLALTSRQMGVEALELPLTDDLLTEHGPHQWRSRDLTTTTYSMVGFTWRRGESEPQIEVSPRAGGSWRTWQRMPHVHDAPDTESSESTDTVGTDLAWVGRADGLRIRVTGTRPAGFTLVLLHPNRLPTDLAIGSTSTGKKATTNDGARARSAQGGDGAVPPPDLLRRRDWGADEDWRERPPTYNDTIRQVHVHHTANSNDYTRSEVPALIRGMYAYHTQSLGWSDIGYNFLVDRFGRIWVGRAGGPARPVRGAHTLGFNATSTGVSVIGNFDVATPGRAVIGAISRVAAWKLGMYGRDPQGRTTVTSEGSDKFRSGRRVTLPVIDGHRDTNDTACPGQHLYDALPRIRRRTKERMDRFAQPSRAEITEPFTASGAVIDGELLTVRGGAWQPPDATPAYTWLRNGAPIASATSDTYRLSTADVGSTISVRVEVAATGLEPDSQQLGFDGQVKARTVLAVRARGRRGRLVVRVSASAAGLSAPPAGAITVAVAERSRTVPLADGSARVVFRRLQPGTYEAYVSYAGDDVAAAASASDPGTVKPAS